MCHKALPGMTQLGPTGSGLCVRVFVFWILKLSFSVYSRGGRWRWLPQHSDGWRVSAQQWQQRKTWVTKHKSFWRLGLILLTVWSLIFDGQAASTQDPRLCLCLCSVPVPDSQGNQWYRLQGRGHHIQSHHSWHLGHSIPLYRSYGEERGQLAEETREGV